MTSRSLKHDETGAAPGCLPSLTQQWLIAIAQGVMVLHLAGSAPPAFAQSPQQDSGVTFGAGYTLDLLNNVSGGIQQGSGALGKLDASMMVDAGKFGIEGATAFINLQFVHGRAFSEEVVGDAQVVSNIEAVSALRPLEAWLELPLAPEGSVKLGLVDLNSEFDVQPVGELFLNSSHGIGPDFSQTGLNGPSIFPTTAGAVVFKATSEAWAARLGFLDAVAGDPDRPRHTRIGYPGDTGLLTVVEVERVLADGIAAKAGAWTYSGRFDALDETDRDGTPKRIGGNRGAYLHLRARLAERRGKEMHAWLRYGTAKARINPIAATIGGGITFGNDQGRAGLAISHARLGGPGMQQLRREGLRPRRAETAFELTYAVRFTDQLTLQPNIQFVVNPGWGGVKDALVVGLRTVFEIGGD